MKQPTAELRDDEVRMRKAMEAFDAWRKSLPPETRTILDQAGIVDFDGGQRAGHDPSLDEDESLFLQLGGRPLERVRADFNQAFLDTIDPDPQAEQEAEARRIDAAGVLSPLLAVVRAADPFSSLLAVAELIGFGAADGVSILEMIAGRPERAFAEARAEVRAMFSQAPPSRSTRFALGRLLRWLLAATNPRIETAALLLAIGAERDLGGNALTLSAELGCTRQNLSKSVIRWRERLNLPREISSSKSESTCRRFAQTQRARHWRRVAGGFSIYSLRGLEEAG